MPFTFSQIVLAVVIILVGLVILPLLRWIYVARCTGLPFVVVPWYNYNQPTAFLLSRFVLKYINAVLPAPGVVSWRRLTLGNWPLKLRHGPFAKLQSDTFWIVAPGGLILNTADASVIHDVVSRDSEFPKATQIYKAIGIYGQNVIASDGHVWKHHRTSATRAFNDGNNRLVWSETIEKIQDVLKIWVKGTVHNVQRDTSRVSLEVIGRAALGQRMHWSQQAMEIGEDARSLARGYTMTFSSALKGVATNAMAIAALRGSWIPWWMLKRFPITSKLCQAYDEWGKYMNDIISAKRLSAEKGPSANPNTDLLDLLCRSQDKKSLSDSEVLGNLFVFIIAGHETSASSLQIIIILLAMHPQFQKEIQKELTQVFQNRPPSQWAFENDFPRLCNCGMLVAAVNEEMRLISPVMTIPKVVCSTPQQLEIDGQTVTVPADTIVRLCVPSVHKNPRYWPHGPPTYSSHPDFAFDNLDNDLEEYNPQRWLENEACSDVKEATSASGNRLSNPIKGAFVPFSGGSRSCLGQKFAKVEILAALAVIFSSYSVELATDHLVEDSDMAGMKSEEKKIIWNKAVDAARDKWQNKLTCAFTVQLNEDIPLRFVKRGEETFFDL